MGGAILVLNSQLTRTLSYRYRIHCRLLLCVLAILNNCWVIAGSLRVTYDLLRYGTIFMQRYGGLIMATSLRVLWTTVRQCASFVRVWARSAESPINGNGVAVKHSFSTHNYSGWISLAIHIRYNNLVHFLWIYINLLNNHWFQEENQSVFVCQGPAHLPEIPQLHSQGEKHLWTCMQLALCHAKSNECRTIPY